MSDKFVTSPGLADAEPGQQGVSRLADRLATMAPALPAVAAFDAPTVPPPPRELPRQVRSEPMAPLSLRPPQHAPTFDTRVAAAPGASVAKRRRRSIIGGVIDGFVCACSFVPYALVALALRLVMARVFFLDGQTRIDGPHFAYSFHGFDVSVILPMQVKTETLFTFMTQYAALPVPGAIAAYLVGYAEFVLPLMLVLGFGTRIAALGLLIMTAMIQLFVMPQALWTTHIYWASLLLVLLSLGPGKISLDHAIRWLSRRKSDKSDKTGRAVS
jgi:putative oxidoreductase